MAMYTLELELIHIILAPVIFLIFMGGVFALGLLTDIRKRLKVMEIITRKEHFIVNLISPDRKRFTPFITQIPGGTIRKGGMMWVSSDSRIYREGKTEQGIDVKSDDVKKQMMFDSAGYPTIFVNESDFKPVGFKFSELPANGISEDLRPDEVDAVLNADVQIEMMRKGTGSVGGISITMIMSFVILGLVVGVGVLVFLVKGDATKILEAVAQCVPPVVK